MSMAQMVKFACMHGLVQISKEEREKRMQEECDSFNKMVKERNRQASLFDTLYDQYSDLDLSLNEARKMFIDLLYVNWLRALLIKDRINNTVNMDYTSKTQAKAYCTKNNLTIVPDCDIRLTAFIHATYRDHWSEYRKLIKNDKDIYFIVLYGISGPGIYRPLREILKSLF